MAFAGKTPVRLRISANVEGKAFHVQRPDRAPRARENADEAELQFDAARLRNQSGMARRLRLPPGNFPNNHRPHYYETPRLNSSI